MRIISKFKDYYDGCQKLGADQQLVWVRDSSEIEVKGTAFESFELKRLKQFKDNSTKQTITLVTGAVIMAAKLYPFVQACIEPQNATIFTKKDYHYFYDLDSFAKFLAKFERTPAEIQHFSWFENGVKSKDFKWFEQEISPSLKKEVIESKIVTAVINPKPSVSSFSRAPRALQVEISPCLEKYQFFKVIPHMQAFQELSMYVGGVLPAQSAMPIEISDNDRIIQHGFDNKSFRKEPSKKAYRK